MSPTIAHTHFASGLKLTLVHGDLTQARVTAIVNAAGERLAHGGGLAAAIVKGGGPAIGRQSDEWVAEHGPISHDKPALTGAGDLPAEWVIHAVGPRWGEGDEHPKLATAVRSALAMAEQRGFTSLGLPPISTGIFGFPVDQAAEIVLDTIAAFAAERPDPALRDIQLTIIDQATLDTFLAAFEARWPRTFKSA